MTESIKLTGASGTAYSYEAAAIDAPWNNVAGNFAFGWQSETGPWCISFIGETNSFRATLTDHPLWAKARAQGCTHVLYHANDGGSQARQLEARDLVLAFQPKLN